MLSRTFRFKDLILHRTGLHFTLMTFEGTNIKWKETDTCWTLSHSHLTAIIPPTSNHLHSNIKLLHCYHDTTVPPKMTASSIFCCLWTHTHKTSEGFSLLRLGLLLQGVYYSFSSDMLYVLLSLNNAWRLLFLNPVVRLAPMPGLFGFAFICRGAPHITEVCQTSNPSTLSFSSSLLNNDTRNLQSFLWLTLYSRPPFLQQQPGLFFLQ